MIAALAAVRQHDPLVSERRYQQFEPVSVARVNVRTDGNQNIAGGGLAPQVEGPTESELAFIDVYDLGAIAGGDLDRPVGGAGVDEDDLVRHQSLLSEPQHKAADVPLLVVASDNDRAFHR